MIFYSLFREKVKFCCYCRVVQYGSLDDSYYTQLRQALSVLLGQWAYSHHIGGPHSFSQSAELLGSISSISGLGRPCNLITAIHLNGYHKWFYSTLGVNREEIPIAQNLYRLNKRKMF